MKVTEKFKEITGYDIEKYLKNYVNFANLNYSKIVDYYDGGAADKESFQQLDELYSEAVKIDELWAIYQNAFNTTDFWDLMDLFTESMVKIGTTYNLSKWLRSTRTDRYSNNVTINYVQKQGETIEKISGKTGGKNADDWVQLAISNDLNEEKYSTVGGTILTVKLNNNLDFDIKNVVDSLSQENLYGKDIKQHIEFTDNDVAALFGMDSLMQTVNNIFRTEKGSIPEFPNDGSDPDLIGSNVATFNYPAQMRNLTAMMQKDDRLKSLQLINLRRVKDAVFMELQVKTKIGDIIKKDLAL